MTDALTAIKYHVFDQQTLTMAELLAALAADFEGHERVRQLLLNRTPKYGNDDDYADEVMLAVFEAYFDAVDGRPNTKGGTLPHQPAAHHLPRLLWLGDRRHARRPPGRDARSPRASRPSRAPTGTGRPPCCKSAAKMDHARTGGTLLNQKFTPQLLAGRGRAGQAGPPGAHLLQAGRPPHPVQRRRRRHAARRPGATPSSTAT